MTLTLYEVHKLMHNGEALSVRPSVHPPLSLASEGTNQIVMKCRTEGGNGVYAEILPANLMFPPCLLVLYLTYIKKMKEKQGKEMKRVKMRKKMRRNRENKKEKGEKTKL